MPRDYLVFFEDMLIAINKIKRYSANLSFEEFSKDEMRIDAVVRNLEIVGEAAGNIPSDIREKYPSVQWKKIVGLRNILIHEYFGIDMDILWGIIQNNLDELKDNIEIALQENRTH
ncbi:DUF86 domain-containing protein [Methanolobus zinderi]|uniref:DUF86 domain-containing protein n=1 Tax=Methanolobus zinderi TaxID=536044 RepID=A0A7D5I2Y2_9EURY|nr:DUF86 domain-containing protein [Methanolobus zinderi]KXS43390.1 MAG: Nucleotidyltransferase [Methanolobus sp. T82-4]QLC48908.1 DUF86 domain-containing protein [Methanolobus zinderi]